MGWHYQICKTDFGYDLREVYDWERYTGEEEIHTVLPEVIEVGLDEGPEAIIEMLEMMLDDARRYPVKDIGERYSSDAVEELRERLRFAEGKGEKVD